MATSSTPRRADVDSFYTCQHPTEFAINWRAFYQQAEHRTDATRKRWAHELDVQYGSHPKQRLDLYYPRQRNGAPSPVLVFLHGGGFREGDPTLYGFLGEPYLERGILFASVGYRLIPDSYLPETCRDVEAALGWLQANIGARGGDIDRVFLSGHSAGAMLTALVALGEDQRQVKGLPGDLVKGAVPISGLYDFSAGTDYVRDPAERWAASALHTLHRLPGHTIIAYGTRERPAFGEDSHKLAEALRARGGSVELIELDELDHAETAGAFGDDASPLFQATARMLMGTRPVG